MPHSSYIILQHSTIFSHARSSRKWSSAFSNHQIDRSRFDTRSIKINLEICGISKMINVYNKSSSYNTQGNRPDQLTTNLTAEKTFISKLTAITVRSNFFITSLFILSFAKSFLNFIDAIRRSNLSMSSKEHSGTCCNT